MQIMLCTLNILRECRDSLGNPIKDCQLFVDAVVLISAPDWSVKLSNFENLLEMPFEFGLQTLGFAKLREGENKITIVSKHKTV